MNGRVTWFVAGTAAGLYASIRAKRAAYRATPAGLVDQAGALGVGLRAFGRELHDGMSAREAELHRQLELPTPAPHLSIDERIHH